MDIREAIANLSSIHYRGTIQPPKRTKTDVGQARGFNDHWKYSVFEIGGIKLNKDGGIEIYIAAEKPKDAPEENPEI